MFVLLVLAALGLSLVVSSVARAGSLAIRRWRYRVADRAAIPAYATAVNLPSPVRASAQQAADEYLKALLLREHAEAVRQQDVAITHLAAAGSLLFVAFAFAAASMTVLPESHVTHLFSALVDLFACTFVIIHFVLAGRSRRRWIDRRIKVELLRQWSTTDYIFFPPSDLEQAFRAQCVSIDQALEGGMTGLQSRAGDWARTLAAGTRSKIVEATVVTSATVIYYLRRRPVRQARWFNGSDSRISGQEHTRRNILITLFVVAILAAVIKIGLLTLLHDSGAVGADVSQLIILMAIGTSAAVTSTYMGQNLRSLNHRYRAQRRSLEAWFRNHRLLLEMSTNGKPLAGKSLLLLGDAVAAFEVLMIEELLDWIEISEMDAMELAPS